MKRFLPALLLALANLALAPFMGLLRDWLFETFPGSSVKIVAGVLALIAGGVLLAAVLRIRDGRSWRFVGLGLVVALVLLQSLVFNRGNLRVDVVEKVHFVQYGLLALLVYRGLRGRPEEAPVDASLYLLPVLWAALAGILEEWVQWLVPVRTGEVMDVVLNAYAALCGTLVAVALFPPPEPVRLLHRPSLARARAVLRTAALATLLLAGFYHSAHLGYWVEYASEDPVCRFRSWFTEEGLLAAKAERAVHWASAPPRLEALAVEDRYVSEAGWHIHARNTAWQQQDWLTAWHESQILERYYAPFLDVPPLPGTGNYRLHPDQMRQIEEGFRSVRSEAASGTYTSRVLENRITLWPRGKAAFWAEALSLAAVLLLVSLWKGKGRE